MATLRFADLVIEAERGRDVLGLLLDHGADIRYLCMSGTCGTCRVRVLAGSEHLAPMVDAERLHFPTSRGETRLACQAILTGTGDVVVEQPD